MKEKEILEVIRRQIRCPFCNKLIMKAKFWNYYSIEFVCPRCKNVVEISKQPKEKLDKI